MTRSVAIYSPSRFGNEVWLPVLWSQCKTYYERHGHCRDKWKWLPSYADIHGDDLASVKICLQSSPPDVFAVSLYVWNYWMGHTVAAWVKSIWPHCFVITGGPHQYFQHDPDWFRKHPYIDASLPGECFGELCLQQLLDTLDFQGHADLDSITDLWYPGERTRYARQSQYRSQKRQRKLFDYDWPSYADQAEHIDDFIQHAGTHSPGTKLLAVLETTRGCPYGCTYCDWGGGINTTVIKKNSNIVHQDIDYLCGLDLKYLYLADANFGIFERRDIDIMMYLCNQRQRTNSRVKLGYGGFAKTENRLDTIQQILQLDLDHDLSSNQEIKISMQSLDPTVLANIDRKNIALERQLTAFAPMSQKKQYPIYVEMIMGLPGMDLGKFYQELDILGQHGLSVMWFEWILLPEAPAYSASYRQKFGIDTVTKTQGWSVQQSGGEHHVVVACVSYSRVHYLEMLIATGWYHALTRGGMFSRCVDWIKKHHAIGLGALIQDLIAASTVLQDLDPLWQRVMTDHAVPATVPVHGESVYLGYYIPARWYFAPTAFYQEIETVLEREYHVPTQLFKRDVHDLDLVRGQRPWHSIMQDFYLYRDSGTVLRPQSKLRGIKDLLTACF